MAEHIDDAERRIRIKELQLALLRGDIGQAEHDRRRARYEPDREHATPRIVTISEALEGGLPVLDPLGNRIHHPGEPQYEAWRARYVVVTPVIAVFCVAVPLALLALLAGALWLLFGR